METLELTLTHPKTKTGTKIGTENLRGDNRIGSSNISKKLKTKKTEKTKFFSAKELNAFLTYTNYKTFQELGNDKDFKEWLNLPTLK